MALPRFYVPGLMNGDVFELPEAEAKHASSALRLKAGDTIVAFDGLGNQAMAVIESVSKKRVDCRSTDRQFLPGELPERVVMAVALPKGDRQRSVIEKGVELGVHCLVPLSCHRSVAEPTEGAVARLQRYVLEASKQCGRNRLMEIGQPVDFDALIQIPDPNRSVRWIAHPYFDGEQSRPIASKAGVDTWWIAVGPEGGFSPEEIAVSQKSGWSRLKMGNRILRVETAVAYAATMMGLLLEPPLESH